VTALRNVKEPFSCLSHLLGVLLAIPGLVYLVAQSDGDPRRTVGFCIYGLSLIVLYSASSLYHGLSLSPRWEDLLRRFDHIAIFVLIAGTYTPICLITLHGRLGWSLLGVVWGLTLLGMLAKVFLRHLPRWVSTSLYLLMGWLGIIAVVPLARAVPGEGLVWLLAGGLFYSVGAAIYGAQRPDPFPQVFGFHDIFHVFVLAGSFAHFMFMLGWVLPTA